jgi:ABC-type uncharacterized transport system ATPase subunit
MTVEDNLLVALSEPRSRDVLDARTEEVLSLIALAGAREQLAGTLAHGQKQWLEIGMAVMARPRLLLLDEPTAGMTPEETQRTAALVHRMSADTAVVAIEHDMSFVRALRCHTRVMHQGRIIVEGAFDDIEKDRLVRDVYLGRA